jgi:CHASE2 domain-containing sensor protein/signal transduction histidine kinase
MNLRLRLIVEWLAIAVLSSLAVVLALQWRGTSAFDYLFYDQLSGLSRPQADADILLVTIDDNSLATLGRWPWPRLHHAQLLEKLHFAKPRSIALDVILSEAADPLDDASVAQEMKGPAPVYVPLHFATPGSDGRDYDVVKPIPIITNAAAGIGQVNVEFDNDGVVRRTILCFPAGEKGEKWPHLMELVARGEGGKPSAAYNRGDRCGSSLLIPYAPRGSFTEISYIDLLASDVPAELIKGKDVIIGATAAGLGDSYPVPLADGGLLSGAEIMANMLGAIRRDNFITPLTHWQTVLLSLLPVWLLLIGFLRWRPRVALIASLAMVALVLAGSAALLGVQIWFPPGAAVLGLFLVYPLWGWRRLQAMSDFMDSEIGDLEREGTPLPLPQSTRLSGDIVGRQSASLAVAIDQLRDLRRFVSDSLEHLPDPMLVSNNAGIVTMANHLSETRLGSDIIGLPLTDVIFRGVGKKQRAIIAHYLDQRRSGDEEGDEFVRFVARDDRTFVLRSADILDDNDIVQGQIHYLADITDLARAETDREEALQLLSHDMRAPQSAIIAMLPDLSDRNARARIEKHARRTMQLAQDFVQIARMGETEFDGTDILLAELARDVADSLWPLAKERGITIDVIDHEGDVFVFAEADSLSRALTNLVDNAIKHSPDGGRIMIDVARVDDAMVELRVVDEGGGIDAALLPSLFTRFSTGREGQSRAKSLGLGLSFVRAVAERHQGKVRAENYTTGGACFVLTLPESVEIPPDADG